MPAALLIALSMGRYPVNPLEVLTVLFQAATGSARTLPDKLYIVILNVRLPRILTAAAAGAALSASGAAYQGMFRNPMASPDLLGASAGAAFGAALGIVLSFSQALTVLMSFSFGLIAVLITYLIGMKTSAGRMPVSLILCGILVGTLFSSLVTLIKYTADPFGKLPAITFWLMGSFASVTNSDLLRVLIGTTAGLIPLVLLRWRLNILSFDDEEIYTMGVNAGSLRLTVIICSTLMTAIVVSAAGLIGWVGLVVPHMARMLAGPDYRKMIPASIIVGGAFLLLTDTAARCIGTMEIPIGILTAFIGAPFFIWLMIREQAWK